jgi:hypothetical protein
MKVYKITDKVRFNCNYNAGHAWAAIKNGQVVAFITMNSVDYISAQTVINKGFYKYDCKGARRMAEKLQREAFLKHREESKKELAKLGQVVSGVLSGLQFYCEV